MKNGRWVELIALFVGVPFVPAVCLPPRALYPVLAVSGFPGIIMLHLTRGFRWRELFGAFRWGEILTLGLVTFLASSFFCWFILPERLFTRTALVHINPSISSDAVDCDRVSNCASCAS